MSRVRRLASTPFVVMPVVAVLVLAGFAVWMSRSSTETVATAATTQLVTVGTGTMSRTVSADGTVAKAASEDLSFAASGTVTAVNVAAGQAVRAGDVLATIDSAELRAAVADAETTLAEATATLSDDYIAGATYAQIAADQASVITAQDRVDAANEDLAGAQLVATFDGTVATVDLTVGEELGSGGTGATSPTGSGSGSGQSSGTLGSSASTGAAGQGTAGATGTTGATTTVQIQVVSTATYVVELGLDDTDIAEVAVGQPASIALSTASAAASPFPGGFGGGGFGGGGFGAGPAAPTTGAGRTGSAATAAGSDEPTGAADAADGTGGTGTGRMNAGTAAASGTVTEVGTVADASSGVATYPVTVTFEDTTGTYNAGATVQVDITYAEAKDVVQVSALAVTTSGGTSSVTVSADGVTESRAITTGLTSGAMVEVTSGLTAGEQVVVTMRGPGGGGFAPGGAATGDAPQGFPGAPAAAADPATGTATDATEAGTDG